MLKKLSVIVPIYNSEKYLKECLDSITNQTYKNLEIILVDDGSTDSSIEIIKQYQILDKRIKIFKQGNLGVSIARNLGIENSTGEFITFVDSDDWIELDMYEKLINRINKTNSDLILCSFKREYKNKSEPEILFFERETILSSKEIYKNLLLNMISGKNENKNKDTIMAPIWRCIFKREKILKEKILFDTEMSLAEDLIFCLKYFKNCNKVYIYNENLYHYRFNSESAVNTYNKNLWENHLLVNKKISEVFGKNSNKEIKERLNFRLLFASIDSILNVCHRDNKDSFFTKYKRTKRILNDDEMEQLRKNYKIKNIKYKILKYNMPLIIYVIINRKNILNKKYLIIRVKRSK